MDDDTQQIADILELYSPPTTTLHLGQQGPAFPVTEEGDYTHLHFPRGFVVDDVSVVSSVGGDEPAQWVIAAADENGVNPFAILWYGYTAVNTLFSEGSVDGGLYHYPEAIIWEGTTMVFSIDTSFFLPESKKPETTIVSITGKYLPNAS